MFTSLIYTCAYQVENKHLLYTFKIPSLYSLNYYNILITVTTIKKSNICNIYDQIF